MEARMRQVSGIKECRKSMLTGTEVEYQTGVAEFARGAVATFDSDDNTVIIDGCEYPVSARLAIEVSALPAFAAWRGKWLDAAIRNMASCGMDAQDVEAFASDNEDTLRVDFKRMEAPETSAKKMVGAITHLPQFENQ